MVVFEQVKKEDLDPLLRKNFGKEANKTIYETLRLRNNDANLVLYTSGKLVVQGKGLSTVTKQLEKLGLKRVKQTRFVKEEGIIIGSDETLKGDTFGGLVVAAVKGDETLRKQLRELGVTDSKKLKDKEILYLADELKKIVPCKIISLLPEEYNTTESQTVLLNKLHKEAANSLGKGKHVVDKYPGCTVGSIREERAEEKYLEVAAASILARAAGVQQLDYLSAMAGMPLPKGSTHVKLALQEMKRKKLPFRKFAKLHFRNVQEYL